VAVLACFYIEAFYVAIGLAKTIAGILNNPFFKIKIIDIKFSEN
jgi:hypothetical protein